MKAIVVRQPWATLIALGVKTIETRPSPPNGPMRPEGVRGLPGCSLERGERVAIVAGAARPKRVYEGYDVPTSRLIEVNESPWLWTEYSDGGGGYWEWWWGTLGAVVCTATVDDALPMEPCPPYSSSFDDRWEPEPASVLYLGGLDGGPWAFIDGKGPINFVDQLPLGDYEDGRWGWLLGNVEPCEPISCKGRQGVFTLPDDAEVQA